MRATRSRSAHLGPLRGNDFIVGVLRPHRKPPCHKNLQLTVTGSRLKKLRPQHLSNARPAATCN
jgi:hypothetical protein